MGIRPNVLCKRIARKEYTGKGLGVIYMNLERITNRRRDENHERTRQKSGRVDVSVWLKP